MKNTDLSRQVAEAELAYEKAVAAIPGRPSLEILNYRSHGNGMDGPRWSCVLVINGVKAATVNEDGDGGPLRIDWSRSATSLKEGLISYIKLLPPAVSHYGSLPMTEDLFIETLVDHHVFTVKLYKDCAKYVCVRRLGQPKTEYSIFKGPFTVDLKESLIKKFGADIEFLNETVANQSAITQTPEEKEHAVLAPYIRKGYTVFKGADTKGEWRIISRPLTPELRAQILESKGSDIVFYNDNPNSRK